MNNITRLNELTQHCEKKEVCIGINWEKKKKSSFKNILKRKKNIDLDASMIVYDQNMNLIDIAYYNHLHTKDNAIWHSGDNTSQKRKFEKFNEVIDVKFSLLDKNAFNLFLILTSYEKHDLSSLKEVKLNIYEGTPYKIEKVLITHELVISQAFNKKSGAVLARFYKENEEWYLKTISEPLEQHKISELVKSIPLMYPKKR